MSKDYKELFNNAVNDETNRRAIEKNKVDKIKADIEELSTVLEDVVDDVEGADVDKVADEIVFACQQDELLIKLDTSVAINVVVKKKTVSFIDEGTDVVANVNEEELDRYAVELVDDELQYDAGALLLDKEELFDRVIERAAEMVAKSE